MGFSGKPASRAPAPASKSRTSTLSSLVGRVTTSPTGKVRVHRRSKHRKMHSRSARVPRIYSELMRDMMETNRAMRYAMIARATH